MFSRRHFLAGSASVLAATAIPQGLFADPASSTAAVTVSFDPEKLRVAVPDSFVGLSYEEAQLGNSGFFSADNKVLVEFFRTLGEHGVLRIGGNSSEYCHWGPDAPTAASSAAPADVPPDTGGKAHRLTTIQPDAFTNLATFLDATGWDLIYGVNLGTGTPSEAADVAVAVSKAVGKRLIALQIGNEPDLYRGNGLRPTTYALPDYLAEWTTITTAINQKTPGIVYGGADSAGDASWTKGFASAGKPNVGMITDHRYVGGSNVTIEHLLTDDLRISGVIAAANAANLPFRMTETNSIYNGGKLGVSNTFASALWGAHYMLQLAEAGAVGINFHGGGFGKYTPIAGAVDQGYSARPLYYGILFASQLCGMRLVSGDQASDPATHLSTLDAFCGEQGGQTRIALINRDTAQDLDVTVQTSSKSSSAHIWRLAAPSVDSTTSVTLGGAVVSENGDWHGSDAEKVPISGGSFTVHLPAASALLAIADDRALR